MRRSLVPKPLMPACSEHTFFWSSNCGIVYCFSVKVKLFSWSNNLHTYIGWSNNLDTNIKAAAYASKKKNNQRVLVRFNTNFPHTRANKTCEWKIVASKSKRYIWSCATTTTTNTQTVLIYLGEFGCSEEILSIAAMLQIKNVFVSPSNEKRNAVCSDED